MRRGPLTAVLSAIALACTAVTSTSAVASAGAQQNYVALGDSYSAASGVLPPDVTAPVFCMRSTKNYPHVIAAKTGAHLTDVTCGGADTSHFTTAQYPDAPPQLDALSDSTDFVTMTIGGNDSGVFINTLVSCGAAGISTAGRGSPCKDRYGDSFENTIKTKTYPSLVTALKAVHAHAPNAKVAILGYPWVMPPTTGCFDKMPVAAGDVPYVHGIQATLNDAVGRAAAATGTTYVDMNTVSESHDACKPIGTRWIEPVLQGTNPVIVHPNALGEAEMATNAMTVMHVH